MTFIKRIKNNKLKKKKITKKSSAPFPHVLNSYNFKWRKETGYGAVGGREISLKFKPKCTDS